MQPSVCLEWFKYISYAHSPAKYDGDGGNVRAGDIKLIQISNFMFNFACAFVCKTSTNKNESKKTHIWEKKVERKFQFYWKYIVGIAVCYYYFIFFYLEMAESERALSCLFKYKSLAMRWWLVKDSIAIAIVPFSTFHSDILCVYIIICCKSFIFKYILQSER